MKGPCYSIPAVALEGQGEVEQVVLEDRGEIGLQGLRWRNWAVATYYHWDNAEAWVLSARLKWLVL